MTIRADRIATVCGATLLVPLTACVLPRREQTGPERPVGQTIIARWQDDRAAAISITYDGGTINQFHVALPIMNRLGLPATFFIVTGDITGSQYRGKFLGRPLEDILRESATVPVNPGNFFERAAAVRYLGYEGLADYHTRAGDFFELGKTSEAYAQIEEAYARVRHGDLKPGKGPDTWDNETVDVSWTQLREIAAQGHEFGSHSVSHPQPAIIDDVNLAYELEESREELLHQLGPHHTFSCECPHGSENPRVMARALAVYPALRNRMPEPFLEEINRWSPKAPARSDREYVQWQRGPKTTTSLDKMKAWVDTCLEHDNLWLVLTFHGIDGIGYEPKTGEEISGFFGYIQSKEDRVWVATFQDVTKYMRERMNGLVRTRKEGKTIQVTLTHTLDPGLYDLALTLKTYVPSEWGAARVAQGETIQPCVVQRDEGGAYVLYRARPNAGAVVLESE